MVLPKLDNRGLSETVRPQNAVPWGGSQNPLARYRGYLHIAAHTTGRRSGGIGRRARLKIEF